MLVLGLDTTGPECAAAVCRGRETLACASERIGRGHAERLGPMVLDVLARAGVSAAKIDRVAVCTGPGSFTGLRVALSFAKGFVLPRRIPLIGIDRLRLALAVEPEALVIQDIKRGDAAVAKAGQNPVIMPITDAEALAALHGGPVIRGPDMDVEYLAQLAPALDPKDYPAEAFYGRKPDAKLPGGIDPSAASARP